MLEMVSKWFDINPLKLKDEHFYDIQLEDGSVIVNVEFWVFGGIFLTDGKEAYEKVVKFRPVK